MQINLFSGHDSTMDPTLNAFNLRPIGLTQSDNDNMSWCSSMWPTYSDTLRIELLERIDSEDTNIKDLGQTDFPIIESDSFEVIIKTMDANFMYALCMGMEIIP